MRQLEEGHFLGVTRDSFYRDGIIVSQTVYHEPVYQGWHCHEHHHLSLLVKGGNREQRARQEREVAAGQVLFYNSGERHRNSHTQHPSRNINLEIPDSFLKRHGLQFTALEHCPERQEHIKYALLKIYKECLHNDAHSAASISALLLPLFTLTPIRKKGMPSWVARLRELLHDRWNETLSLQELSQVLGVHPVTVSRYFPVYFDCSLGEYMRKIKIDKAMVMLQTEECTLTTVAYACGFFDQSHFIRTFKSVTGFLPRQFRQL